MVNEHPAENNLASSFFDPFLESAVKTGDTAISNAAYPLDKIDDLITEVFLTPAGLKLLAYLEQITVLRPSFNIHINLTATGKDALAYGCFREGQNDIVRQLIEALSRSSSQPTTLRAKLKAALKKLVAAI